MIHIVIKSPVSGEKHLGVVMLSRMGGGEPADRGAEFRFWRPQNEDGVGVGVGVRPVVVVVVVCRRGRRLRVLLVPSPCSGPNSPFSGDGTKSTLRR